MVGLTINRSFDVSFGTVIRSMTNLKTNEEAVFRLAWALLSDELMVLLVLEEFVNLQCLSYIAIKRSIWREFGL